MALHLASLWIRGLGQLGKGLLKIRMICIYFIRADKSIECFHMTSRRPYWCPKTMTRRPCWCPTPILWELNSFLMWTPSFVPINLHRCSPHEWKHSIAQGQFLYLHQLQKILFLINLFRLTSRSQQIRHSPLRNEGTGAEMPWTRNCFWDCYWWRACQLLAHRPFARWRHFTTTTRILQSFAFLCKLRLLLFKPRWDFQI